MVEKIQLSVAAYFQSLENPQAEAESLEVLADEEIAEESAEQAEAAEEVEEAADVAVEDSAVSTEAEEELSMPDVEGDKLAGDESHEASKTAEESGNK
jgi:hypothetical protein